MILYRLLMIFIRKKLVLLS